MKIDMHVHVTPPEIIKEYKKIGEREPYFNLLSNSPQNKFADTDTIIEEMQKTGIDRSVIFGFSFKDRGLCEYVNDYVIESIRTYPERLIGFASIVPNDPKISYEIERCYKAGLRGIGELFPAGQDFEIENARHTAEMAKCACHYKMPIIIHTNEPIGHDYIGKTNTSLKQIEEFIKTYPELYIILAHWGGGIFLYELMKEVKETFQNVYYDNAASIFLYDKKIYKIAETLGIIDKILFGSDYPLVSPTRYQKGIDESGIMDESKDKIEGANARNLLKKCGII